MTVMFLLSAIKKAAIQPKEYFEQEKNNAKAVNSLANFFVAALCLILPLILGFIYMLPQTRPEFTCPYQQIHETNLFYKSLPGFIEGIGFCLILFCISTFVLAKAFKGKGDFFQHLNALSLAIRNSLLPIEMVLFLITIALKFATMQESPLSVILLSIIYLAYAGIFIFGTAYVLRTVFVAIEASHELQIPKKIAITLIVLIGLIIVGMFLLMNILGDLATGTNDPVSTISNDLKYIVSSGFGVSEPKKVMFYEGTMVSKCLIGDLPIAEKELGFFCGAPDFCQSSNAAIDVQKEKIQVNNKSEAYVTVCGNDSPPTGQEFKYCVGIGMQASDARKACVQNCHLNQ